MNLTEVTAFVTLVAAISVAAERLVEIIKGFSAKLSTENPDPDGERKRKLLLHLLAILAGIVTAALVPNEIVQTSVKGADVVRVKVVLGVLAGGGSSFWNSILSYLNLIKQIKRTDLADRRAARVGSSGAV